MSKIPASKIKKYEAIVEKLEKNQQVWQAIGAMQNAVNDIKNLLELFVEAPQEKKKRGPAKKSDADKATENLKTDRRNILNKRTATLTGSLYAYMIDAKESSLDKKYLVSSVQMANKNDKQALIIANHSLEIAKNHIQKLMHYGVTQDELTTLQTTIQEFEEVAGNRKAVPATVEVQTKEKINFTKTLKDIDDILEEKVDRLLLRFEDSHADFYKSYKRARKGLSKAEAKKETATENEEGVEVPIKRRAGRPKTVNVA